MGKIIIWYNRKRKMIWTMILVIVITILLVQLLNYLSRVNRKNNTNQTNYIIENDTSTEYNSIKLEHDESVLTGEKISDQQGNTLKTIEQFVEFCNNNETEKAYNLLSDECKEQMYPTIDVFYNAYYKDIFTSKKVVTVENWINNIYKVKYNDDSLSTGIYSENNIIQDYITLVIDNEGKYKLNINSYIGRNILDSYAEYNNISVQIKQIDSYMDYQEYTYVITNKSENTILLDDGTNINSLYIIDDNNITYSAYTHEISEANLKLAQGETKKIKIKYYSKFSSEKEIVKAVFSRILLNYEKYENLINKNYYNEYGKIEVTI